MQIEQRKLGDIRPYAGNPRQNDAAVDAVARSIAEFGFRQPIVVDSEGLIVVGHTRYRAAQKLGLDAVPVHVARELSEAQARAYRLADNRTAQLAEWDMDLLPLELAELKDLGIDMEVLGWSDEELRDLLAGPDDPASLTDPDALPELPAQPVTRPGDLWLLGEHRLLCGDSTSAAEVARLMGGQRADLVLTDPPYGISYEGNQSKRRKEIANDTEAALRPLLSASLGLALEHSRPGAVWYVAAPAGPQHLDFAQVLADLGVWRQSLVWVKNSFVFGRSDYHYRHEALFYGWAPGASHREPPTRDLDTVLEFARPKASPEHPTMKPPALWGHLMANSTARGDLVLDPFSGSGTSIAVAQELGRRCCAMELEPGYADVAVRRWMALTGGEGRLEGSGRTWSEVAAERGVPAGEAPAVLTTTGEGGDDDAR